MTGRAPSKPFNQLFNQYFIEQIFFTGNRQGSFAGFYVFYKDDLALYGIGKADHVFFIIEVNDAEASPMCQEPIGRNHRMSAFADGFFNSMACSKGDVNEKTPAYGESDYFDAIYMFVDEGCRFFHAVVERDFTGFEEGELQRGGIGHTAHRDQVVAFLCKSLCDADVIVLADRAQ